MSSLYFPILFTLFWSIHYYNFYQKIKLLKRKRWEFAGSPVVKTVLSLPRAWVWSLAGELRSNKPPAWPKRKIKKKKKHSSDFNSFTLWLNKYLLIATQYSRIVFPVLQSAEFSVHPFETALKLSTYEVLLKIISSRKKNQNSSCLLWKLEMEINLEKVWRKVLGWRVIF